MNDVFLNWIRAAFRRLHSLDTTGPPGALPESIWLPAARRHRITGLRAGVSSSGAPGDEWCRYIYGQTAHSARLSAEAGRLFSFLRDRVEDLRLIKGPALALQAWPDPGLRVFDDLDLRCAGRSLDALLAGMHRLGYRPEQDSARLRNLWHYGWGISFRHADGYHVECNRRMFPPHYPWPARLEGLSGGWKRESLDGTEIVCPDPALHLVLSCVHAVWHGWERMGWAADIAGLLVQHPECFRDAQKMVRRNRFARRALHCGCFVAVRIFGPLPGVPDFRDREEEAVRLSLSLLMREEPGVPQADCRALHHRLMSPREKTAYTVRRLTVPGDPDFRRRSLPKAFRGLYWILRPVRILSEKKYKSVFRMR